MRSKNQEAETEAAVKQRQRGDDDYATMTCTVMPEPQERVPAPASHGVSWGKLGKGLGIVTVRVLGSIVLVADDATGIGAADDPALVVTGGMVAEGTSLLAEAFALAA